MKIVKLSQARTLPYWRRPFTLLFVMAMAMPIAFSTWSALLNNFVVEVAGFDGADIGLLHTVREIPGFFAIGVIALIMFVREQVLGLVALLLLGVSTGVTAWFPQMGGILTITMLSSIGFHYFETVNQSLQLQWIDRDRAPQMLGWIMAAGSGATLVAYIAIVMTWEALGLSYNVVYLASGGITAALAVFALLAYPQFEAPHPQLKTFVLRRRYWLYYALQFMAGARRQIFVVFAGFMMVERFGFEVHEVTSLFLITLVANVLIAPVLGRIVAVFGEQRALLFEYVGLMLVFLAYGGVYLFGWGVAVAATLYVVDHIFFGLALALKTYFQKIADPGDIAPTAAVAFTINHIFFGLALALKTYFQKIADPGDIAPTAAVAFTINHIAAVFLPVLLGVLWLISPGLVFGLAAGMAGVSVCLALLIPRHPVPGRETRLGARAVVA